MQRVLILILAATCSLADVVPMDQMISDAASDVEDTGLLWDDQSIVVELDMRFTFEQWRKIQTLRGDYGKGRQKRKAYIYEASRWDGGVVPYTISDGFTKDGERVIKEAIAEWERVTCLKFRAASADEPSIGFVPTGGCSSNVGKTGNPAQALTLGSGCLYKGIVIHEIGHALGFFHEQSRPDRDSYINIHKENIRDNMEYNFEMYDTRTINMYKIPYDYGSIMHYGPYYFSKNGRPTITATDSTYTKKLGNRYGLTFNDIKLANLMYKCSKKCDRRISCQGVGFVGRDCRCWCRGTTKDAPVVYCDSNQKIGINRGVVPTVIPTTTTKKSDLVDYHEYCRQWADSNYCLYNRFVQNNCKLSCYLRHSTTTADPNSDLHPNCKYWAEYGECKNNPGYMMVYCRESCKSESVGCEDTVPRMCKLFQKECKSKNLKHIMSKFCPQTCDTCTLTQRLASGLSNCEDTLKITCKLYAKAGKCRANDDKTRGKMQLYCPSACGLCRRNADGSKTIMGVVRTVKRKRECRDRLPQCNTWKKRGRCNQAIWRYATRLLCKKSCNSCD